MLRDARRAQLLGTITVRDDAGQPSTLFFRNGALVALRGPESAPTEAAAEIKGELFRLLSLPRGSFEVEEEDHRFQGGNGSLPLEGVLREGLLAAWAEATMDAALRGLDACPLALGRAVEPTPALAPSDTERQVLDALQAGPRTLADLLALGGRASRIKALVVALDGAGCFSADGKPLAPRPAPDGKPLAPRPAPDGKPLAPRPAPAAPRPAPAAPAPPPADTPASLRAAILDFAKRLDTTNHFEVLGVTQAASEAEVSAAYMAIVRRFHPDRLAGLGAGDLAAQAEAIMSRAGEANAVLSDPEKRKRHVAWERIDKADLDRVQGALQAEPIHQNGIALLRRGSLVPAEEAFAEACRLAPDEPEYAAYLAWTRLQAGKPDRFTARTAAEQALLTALKTRPKFAQGHHMLGLLKKEAGNTEAAARAFQAALTADPHHGDAERELRLINARRPEKKKGLFG